MGRMGMQLVGDGIEKGVHQGIHNRLSIRVGGELFRHHHSAVFGQGIHMGKSQRLIRGKGNLL